MSEHNPYDFLSGDAPANGASPEPSDSEKSVFEENAPEATIPRAESVAALEARESYETNGHSVELATVPELAPLAEPQSAVATPTEIIAAPADSERTVLKKDWDANARPHDQEQDLFQHLAELRSRMLRAISYIFLASLVTWNQTQRIQDFLLVPVLRVLKEHHVGGGITTTDPMQAFTTYFQLALVSAVIVAAPLVLWEMWRFIEPALTHNEKRYSGLLVPFSILLFALGCALGYFTSPLFFNFFLAFVPPGVTVLWTYTSVVTLLGKMLLVFGVCFQVPVIVIFLNKTGVVHRNLLIEYWRHVVVVIFTVVAIITPTWDPFTLIICSIPPCLLYGLSLWILKWL